MKIIDQNTQPKVRRKAAEKITAINLNTREELGIVVDLSARGMKLKSENPATVGQIYYCRLPLRRKLDGRREIFFDAECKWCNRYEDTGRFYSGYFLRFPSGQDAELVQSLVHQWMKANNEEFHSRLHGSANEKRGLFNRLFSVATR